MQIPKSRIQSTHTGSFRRLDLNIIHKYWDHPPFPRGPQALRAKWRRLRVASCCKVQNVDMLHMAGLARKPSSILARGAGAERVWMERTESERDTCTVCRRLIHTEYGLSCRHAIKSRRRTACLPCR
jgi:hypothetical protein